MPAKFGAVVDGTRHQSVYGKVTPKNFWLGGRCRYQKKGKKKSAAVDLQAGTASRGLKVGNLARVVGKGPQQLNKGKKRQYNDTQDLCGAACM